MIETGTLRTGSRNLSSGSSVLVPAWQSKQFSKFLKGHRTHLSDLGEDSMKRSGFQRIVQRDGNRVNRKSRVSKLDVASFLAHLQISEVFQHPDDAVAPRGNFTLLPLVSTRL